MKVLNRFSIIVSFLFCTSLIEACTDVEEFIPIPNDKPGILNTSSDYIAIFGDIQYYTNLQYINLYRHSIDWILHENKNGRNIECVLHTGDITQTNDESQYEDFYYATYYLGTELPYYSLIGDHDYTWYDGIHIDGREDTHFNEYAVFPQSMQHVVAQFETGRMENIVVRTVVQGQDLYFILLEFGPRDEVVEWANQYVKRNPDIKFIVCTHEYLEMGGGRRTKGLKCVGRLQNTTYNTPEQLWNRLIKCNDNIICVLCGHVGGLYALTIDVNDYGHEVAQIQHNIQGSQYRYDNWLMLWEFPEKGDSANVLIFNTKTEQYYDNKTTLFRFKY